MRWRDGGWTVGDIQGGGALSALQTLTPAQVPSPGPCLWRWYHNWSLLPPASLGLWNLGCALFGTWSLLARSVQIINAGTLCPAGLRPNKNPTDKLGLVAHYLSPR